MTPSDTVQNGPVLLRGIAHMDAVDALSALHALRDALGHPHATAPLEDIARALPRQVANLSAEVALALAEVAAQLVEHHPHIPNDIHSLAPRARLAWLRTAAACGALPELNDHWLLRVVAGFDLAALPDPLPVLQRLAAASDARCRAVAVSALPSCIAAFAVEVAALQTMVDGLVHDPDTAIAADALRMLASPGFRANATVVREALLHTDVYMRSAAIHLAVATGHHHLLRDVLLSDVDIDVMVRVDIISAWGAVATSSDDLDVVFAHALEDAIAFGQAARTCLLEAHQRGVFVRSEHIEPLLVLFDAHHGWTAEEVVRITFTARQELGATLEAIDVNDRRWIRRARILSLGGRAAAAVLRTKMMAIDTTTPTPILIAWLDAAAREPSFDDEAAIVRWLRPAPEAALRALHAKGTSSSSAAVAEFLEDPFCFPAHRQQAMAALWSWSPQAQRPALLQRWAERFGPHESKLLSSSFVQKRDTQMAAVLLSSPWQNIPAYAVSDVERLRLLCESGAIEHLAAITALFRSRFVELVHLSLQGDFTVQRQAMPALEQQLFRYGRWLVEDQRCVRPFVLDEPETGRDLVLAVLCDWLDEGAEDAVVVALLTSIGRHQPTGRALRTVERFWRKGSVNVRRAAIEAIISAGDQGRGLAFSLAVLIDGDTDARLLRQAIAATRLWKNHAAQQWVRAALHHPDMGVKKEAAEALVEIGTAASVPDLIEWLSRTDNDAFRTSLRSALERAAGPMAAAAVVAALEHESEPRRRSLLHQALGGWITLPMVMQLARQPSPARQAIVEACVRGDIAVKGVTLDELIDRLHRTEHRARLPAADDPLAALRRHGFSAAAAEAAVALRSPAIESALLAVVRASAAEWLSWAVQPNASVAAVELVIDAIHSPPATQVDALLTTVENRSLSPSSVSSLLQRCATTMTMTIGQRHRAMAIVRAWPPSSTPRGLERYRLLGSLGAVRTADDLASCLETCRVGSSVMTDSLALLCDALVIPQPAITTIDKQRLHDATEWYRLPADHARAWLLEACDQHPIDIDPVQPARVEAKLRFVPRTTADLDKLLLLLDDDDSQLRQQAAVALLAWPDAAPHHERVLLAHLRKRIDLPSADTALLTPWLTSWPTNTDDSRTQALLPWLTPHQLRSWLPGWWASENPIVHALSEEWRLPLVASEVANGNLLHVSWLRPATLKHSSAAKRALIAMVAQSSPALAITLVLAEETIVGADKGNDDPIAGQDVDGIARAIESAETPGIAVRAVHALVQHGAMATDVLDRCTTDDRPAVRSAALRALRQVASRDRCLDAALRALMMESRRDVSRSLMASLGHGRHAPALQTLVTRLSDYDVHVRDAAADALRGWGTDVLPSLQAAHRHARPDRRAAIAALIEELEDGA